MNGEIYTVRWRFRNGYSFIRSFFELSSAIKFIYDTGITTHPDIVSVHITLNGQKYTTLKHEQKEQTQDHN
jgi:hypothetical protein